MSDATTPDNSVNKTVYPPLPMHPNEALKRLDLAAALAPISRKKHIKCLDAVKVIDIIFKKYSDAQTEIAKLQAELNNRPAPQINIKVKNYKPKKKKAKNKG